MTIRKLRPNNLAATQAAGNLGASVSADFGVGNIEVPEFPETHQYLLLTIGNRCLAKVKPRQLR